jgi:phosphoglucomutase/phosphomannomutase
LIASERWSVLADSFYRVVPFGTGGRRGAVGVGPNRINPWTLGETVEAHAQWLKARFPGQSVSVVLGWDTRQFLNLRAELLEDLPCPVRGWRSADFGRLAAEIYAAAGIEVWLPIGEGWAGVLATPELSFAIRALGAQGGLCISASHNHPDDNGGKFYTAAGGQEIPPHDEDLAQRVATTRSVSRIDFALGLRSGQIRPLPESVSHDYRAALLRALPEKGSLRLVYSNLHGTGLRTIPPLLREAGFEVVEVPSQRALDGAFSGVPFRAPNPEVASVFSVGIAEAERVGAPLVLASDPDADRIGAAVKTKAGTYQVLNGNELAALIADVVVRPHGRPVYIQTEVTSGFPAAIARSRGARVEDRLLVGFKYIGAEMDHLAPGEHFALGAEESLGSLISPEMRDKDAAGGALALALAADRAAARGQDLTLRLLELACAHGLWSNLLFNLSFRGAAGRARIQAIQDSLRQDSPTIIGGYRVVESADRQDPRGWLGPIRSETDRSSRDVLVYTLQGGGRLILRPSGTEPKTKIYVELRADPPEGLADAATRTDSLAAETARLGRAFVDLILRRVGVFLPEWALWSSDLLTTEQRQYLADTLWPNLHSWAQGVDTDDGLVRDAPALLAPLGAQGFRLAAPALLRACFELDGKIGARLERLVRRLDATVVPRTLTGGTLGIFPFWQW